MVLLLTALPVSAAVPMVYSNDNFYTAEHDAPVSFSRDAFGNFSGHTVSGKLFTQTAVVSDIHVRLQRFSIDSAYFYISSYGLITATSDLEALSIYLALAGWEEVV